jgi:hypothetical protein
MLLSASNRKGALMKKILALATVASLLPGCFGYLGLHRSMRSRQQAPAPPLSTVQLSTSITQPDVCLNNSDPRERAWCLFNYLIKDDTGLLKGSWYPEPLNGMDTFPCADTEAITELNSPLTNLSRNIKLLNALAPPAQTKAKTSNKLTSHSKCKSIRGGTP